MFVVSLFPTSAAAQYKSVHVNGSEPGKGTAVSRGRDCFVITAAHVVAFPTATVVGEYRKTSSAAVVLREQALDVAVLRVRDPSEICGADYYMRLDVAALLQPERQGVLRVREEDGSEHQIPLALSQLRQRVAGDSFLAFGRTGQLGQGHSGAMFFIDGQPVGMLTEVSTQGVEAGRMLRIDRISREVASLLRLEAPAEEEARLNDQIAGDMLTKNVNFAQTPAFCLNLWRMGKWVANPSKEAPLSPRARRRSTFGGVEADIDSMLISGANTVVTIESGDDSGRVGARTMIGYVPRGLALEPVWRSVEGAIDRCLLSDTNDTVQQIRLRSAMRREPQGKLTTWAVERTGRLGVTTETATVGLKFLGRELTLEVWSSTGR